MRGRVAALAVLLLAALVLSGCNGSKETDDVLYVIGIGIDKADNRMIKVTFQFAIPRALGTGGSSGGSDSKETSAIITFTAPSIAEAYNQANVILSRIPNFSHARMFIVGTELAKDGVGDVMASLNRYRQFRGSMYLLTVKDGTAEDFMKHLESILEILPSKYVEGMMLKSQEAAYFPDSSIYHFYNRLTGKSASPYTALVALNPLTGRDRPGGSKISGEKSEEYTAGNLPISGNIIPVNFAGTALYCTDKLVGVLTTEETLMVQILTGDLKRTFLPLADPLVPDKPINIIIKLREKPKITSSLTEGRYRFVVSVTLEGELTSIPSGIHYEQSNYRVQLENQISTVVGQNLLKMIHKTQKLRSDITGFGYYARHLYGTYPQWLQAREHWEEDYGQAEIEVTVTTKIRRAGLMWKTMPIFSDPSAKEARGQ